MFEDGLDEGMRRTRELMRKEGISYEAASEYVRSMSANAPGRRSLQRELYDARTALGLLRKHRDQLDADIRYTIDCINEIRQTAYQTGETVV
jgi:hypothetical protein